MKLKNRDVKEILESMDNLEFFNQNEGSEEQFKEMHRMLHEQKPILDAWECSKIFMLGVMWGKESANAARVRLNESELRTLFDKMLVDNTVEITNQYAETERMADDVVKKFMTKNDFLEVEPVLTEHESESMLCGLITGCKYMNQRIKEQQVISNKKKSRKEK